MHIAPPATLPRELRPYLDLINQVFEIEKKAGALTESHSIQRNIKNMRNWFEREISWPQGEQLVKLSFTIHNPVGETYSETRTDCDASIAGSGTEYLVITEVIKPIVWLEIGGSGKAIVQQAVVVVESQHPVTIGALAAAIDAPANADSPKTYSLTAGATYIMNVQQVEHDGKSSSDVNDPPVSDSSAESTTNEVTPSTDSTPSSSQPTF